MVNHPYQEDQFIIKVTQIIRSNLHNEQFSVSSLAFEMGMNRTSLYRKIKERTNKSVSKFICEIRLLRAKELLDTEKFNISEVAYKVGFSSPSYFIKCFHDYYGFPPGEVAKNHWKDLSPNYSILKNSLNRIIGKIKLSLLIIIFLAITFILIFLIATYF